MKSETVKDQKREYIKTWREGGYKYAIVATVRYDDHCGNGHNSFTITADIYSSETRRRRDGYFRGVGGWIAGGCYHDKIKRRVPELAPFVKWHLCDAENGPMHYIENSLYFAGHCPRFMRRENESPNYPADWAFFAEHVALGAVPSDPENTAGLEKMTADELKNWLIARKPELMAAFKRDVESLGFVF